MAAANSTLPQRVNPCLGQPLPELISSAMGILAQLVKEEARIYGLATAIAHRAGPADGEELPEDPALLGLAEVLVDLCSDSVSIYSLADCLEAAAAQCKEASHG